MPTKKYSKPIKSSLPVTSVKQAFIAVDLDPNDFDNSGTSEVCYGDTIHDACTNFHENYDSSNDTIHVYQLTYVGKYTPNESVTFTKR